MGYGLGYDQCFGKALLCCAAADWNEASSHQAVGLSRLATKPAEMQFAALRLLDMLAYDPCFMLICPCLTLRIRKGVAPMVSVLVAVSALLTMVCEQGF